MPALAIHDETTAGRRTGSVTLDVPTEAITLRDLVAQRVRCEVDEYNSLRGEYFQGLVQPTESEQTLNGYRVRNRRAIDAEQQVQRALEAFERNGFLVLVGDRQVDSLDAVITIRPATEVSFVKLVPLVGG
jgi:hypothetical protein